MASRSNRFTRPSTPTRFGSPSARGPRAPRSIFSSPQFRTSPAIRASVVSRKHLAAAPDAAAALVLAHGASDEVTYLPGANPAISRTLPDVAAAGEGRLWRLSGGSAARIG